MNNELDRRLLLGAAGLAGVAALGHAARGAAGAGGGPLNPPGGPVGATGKTTDELWGKIARGDAGMGEARIPISAATTPGDVAHQYIISQRGSYYLTENLVGVSGRACVGISVDGVTIDLNGYALIGVTGALAAIKLTSVSGSEVTVCNGHIRGWPAANTVALENVPGVRLYDVTIADSGSVSLGDNAVVERCQVLDGRAVGLATGNVAVVRSCAFRECEGNGVSIASGVVESCIAFGNIGNGIVVTARGTVRGCTVLDNSSAGITVGQGSSVLDCTASQCTHGISLGSGALADRCIAIQNTVAGIIASANCLVTRCVAHLNAGEAIGIQVTASDTRVESCQATDNGVGIQGPNSGSIFIGNTATSNTVNNYFVPAGNFGLFVSAAAMGVAATGNSGGSALGTTDPRANLSY